MSQGFYYSIYPTSYFVGGGPEPEIYPVEQQNLDAREASLRIQARNQRTTEAFMALGAWGPREIVTDPLERSGGMLVNGYV